jgi:hypothetical protein
MAKQYNNVRERCVTIEGNPSAFFAPSGVCTCNLEEVANVGSWRAGILHLVSIEPLS